MSIDIINVNGRHTKQLAVDAFNRVNGINANPDFRQLEFESSSVEGTVILHNPSTQKGVVANKISLGDLFPKTVDLRPFKTRTGNLPEATKDAVQLINAKHNTELAHVGKDVFKGRTNITEEEAKNFLLFCRVFGFYELDVSDFTIFSYDGKMAMSVNPSHKLYTGFIEVLV